MLGLCKMRQQLWLRVVDEEMGKQHYHKRTRVKMVHQRYWEDIEPSTSFIAALSKLSCSKLRQAYAAISAHLYLLS
jgi:hypothetical protein